MVRAHVFISGRVQGVFYRDSTVEKAEEVGVTGWVRNLRDGRVEAVFEGDRDAVDAILRWCHDGPPRAQVDDVDVTWEDPRHPDAFERRSTATAPEPVRPA